jgi:hypothetical protein
MRTALLSAFENLVAEALVACCSAINQVKIATPESRGQTTTGRRQNCKLRLFVTAFSVK